MCISVIGRSSVGVATTRLRRTWKTSRPWIISSLSSSSSTNAFLFVCFVIFFFFFPWHPQTGSHKCCSISFLKKTLAAAEYKGEGFIFGEMCVIEKGVFALSRQPTCDRWCTRRVCISSVWWIRRRVYRKSLMLNREPKMRTSWSS